MAESKSRTTPSRIIGLQFSILSPEEIRKSSVANIVSRDTYVNNKPVIGGLFDRSSYTPLETYNFLPYLSISNHIIVADRDLCQMVTFVY